MSKILTPQLNANPASYPSKDAFRLETIVESMKETFFDKSWAQVKEEFEVKFEKVSKNETESSSDLIDCLAPT